jgi:hypothetical protein
VGSFSNHPNAPDWATETEIDAGDPAFGERHGDLLRHLRRIGQDIIIERVDGVVVTGIDDVVRTDVEPGAVVIHMVNPVSTLSADEAERVAHELLLAVALVTSERS